MARGEDLVESALQTITHAQTVKQIRQAQAVVLPLRCGLSLEMTARVTGLSVGWVSKLRNRSIQGRPVGDASEPARGGVLVVGQIKPQLEEALGRPISLSSVYALLHRHHWRKLAPDKRHPESDLEAQEAWGKNFPKRSSNSAKTGKAHPSG